MTPSNPVPDQNARYDTDPDALAWARTKVQHYIDRLAAFEDHATASNSDKARGLRVARRSAEQTLIGGEGCVVGAFDARRPTMFGGQPGDDAAREEQQETVPRPAGLDALLNAVAAQLPADDPDRCADTLAGMSTPAERAAAECAEPDGKEPDCTCGSDDNTHDSGCPTAARWAREEQLAAVPGDTCRVVEVGGESIRVRGSGEMSDESRAALASLVGAARRKHAAEQARHDDQVRAAAFREAADLIGNDDTCGCGGCDSCTARKDAARLRARADEISGHNTPAGGEQQ